LTFLQSGQQPLSLLLLEANLIVSSSLAVTSINKKMPLGTKWWNNTTGRYPRCYIRSVQTPQPTKVCCNAKTSTVIFEIYFNLKNLAASLEFESFIPYP
jgi:hypothetical protein